MIKVSLRNKLKLIYFRWTRFSDKYSHGNKAHVNLSKIVISKNATGEIRLGDYVICNGELYSFFDKGVISVGSYSYIGQDTRIWALGSIKIGKRVLISHNCFLCDNLTHPLDKNLRHQQFMAKFGFPLPGNLELNQSPITIEDDVWIASGVTILRGVTIGAGSIVAAGSIVVRDVPANVIVGGNPAEIIRDLARV